MTPGSKPKPFARPERPAVLAREQIIEASTLFSCSGEEVMEIWDSRQLPYRIKPLLKKNSWGY